MSNDPAVGPLTHTVSYSGNRFKVTQEQATRITNAILDGSTRGVSTFLGIPATDAGNGHTVVRYLLIGPGIPAMVEGPTLDKIGKLSREAN